MTGRAVSDAAYWYDSDASQIAQMWSADPFSLIFSVFLSRLSVMEFFDNVNATNSKFSETEFNFQWQLGSFLSTPPTTSSNENFQPPPPNAEANSSLIGWISHARELKYFASQSFAYPL